MYEDTPEAYTDEEAVAAYLGESELSVGGSDLERYILAMSMYLDNATKRRLYRTEETTIKYDGDGTGLLVIQDVIDPTVSLDGTDITSSVAKYPTTKRYTSRIVLPAGQYFTKGLQNVEVEGIHAMSDTLLDDVQFACTVLVAGILLGMQDEGEEASERIGNYQVTYKTASQKNDFARVSDIIKAYKRLTV